MDRRGKSRTDASSLRYRPRGQFAGTQRVLTSLERPLPFRAARANLQK